MASAQVLLWAFHQICELDQYYDNGNDEDKDVLCTLTIMALRDASTDIYTVSRICKKMIIENLLMVLHQQKLLIFESICIPSNVLN